MTKGSRHSSQDEHATPRTVLLLATLWLAGLGAAGQFAKIGSVFADVQALYPENAAQVGLLQSALGMVGILCGLFSGLLIARFGFRHLLLPALALGAVLSLVQATLPGFGFMLATRVLEGMSHLVVVVAAPTLMAQISPPSWRPLVMSIWSTFFGMAFALAALFGRPLVDALGLPALFVAQATIMAVSAAVLFVLLPKGIIQRTEPSANLTPRWLWRAHVKAYISPFIAAPALGWFAYALTYLAVLTFLPDHLGAVGREWAGVVLPLVSLTATLLSGALVLPRLSALQTLIAGFALAALMAATLPFLDMGLPNAIVIFIGLGLVQSGSFALVPDLMDSAEDQAQANGAMAQMGNLGTSLGTPVLFVTMQQFGLWGLSVFVVVVSLLGIALHLWCAARRKIA